jgi:diguanylate cyclase (GGDEF)-like protein
MATLAFPRKGDGEPKEPPRLVLRFAILSAIGLALAAASILMLVRHFNTAQAERLATQHARFITESLLVDELQPADFLGPVDGSRRANLDRLFASLVLDGDTMLVELYARDGTIVYATDHRLIGTSSLEPAGLREALSGHVVSDLTTVEGYASDGPLKALRAYVPLRFEGRDETGVIVLYKDYAPIATAARQAFLPIAGVLEVVLLALYALLIPALRRVTRRVKRQMAEIEHRALHDDLTGLPNRALFRDRIGEAVARSRREGGQVAVMLMDLDRFKEVNDALGHQSGDAMLRELGARLAGALGESETSARLGGDEFGVVLPRATPESAGSAAQRILGVVAEPFVLQGLTLEVAASIGIALAPEHGQDVDTLIRHADIAMYLAKEAHSGFAFYDEAYDPSDADRLALVGELRRALERQEFIVEYQPKAELATGRIVGAEALVRWLHPQRGLLRPDEFIPLAERTGLIKQLSRDVLDEALRRCRDWNAAGYDIPVAVNLTVANLLDLELPSEIAELLRDHELPPDKLELEVTESMIMADPFRVRQVLTRLGDMGVRLAIDDFGTGYSSLAYLRRLPVDVLKIDKSFVLNMTRDVGDATIVRSTIDLARNLGLEVVAEGVETPEAWHALRAFGCHIAQGHLIGRPTSAANLAGKLAGASEWTVGAGLSQGPLAVSPVA